MDVVELDAATHRGIDDARDLREKAIYAPAASRYKVYIIDEAHQLTNEAANALLKLVEEPPPHLRFIFATTEPDKIIPTIRSRTFHYGFRLVPARTLAEHLGAVCRSEGVPAEAAGAGGRRARRRGQRPRQPVGPGSAARRGRSRGPDLCRRRLRPGPDRHQPHRRVRRGPVRGVSGATCSASWTS